MVSEQYEQYMRTRCYLERILEETGKTPISKVVEDSARLAHSRLTQRVEQAHRDAVDEIVQLSRMLRESNKTPVSGEEG